MKSTDDETEASASVMLLLCSLLVVATMFFVWCSQGWAAELETGYLTDHPIDPSQMILATQDARYAVRLTEGCSITAGANVLIDREGMTISTDLEGCGYFEAIYLDPTPCFASAGICDARLEVAEGLWTEQ